MPIDMDRYYTPEKIALNALERANFPVTPNVCVDSTCGSGRLLDAANTVFGSVQSIGMDRDEDAISQLRLRRPAWLLSVGDLLNRDSTEVIPKRDHVDLLVLNPPFSHGNKKAVEIVFAGKTIKGSIAMAHLLRSFELFQPKLGAIIIAPESLLYSETDHVARKALEEDYQFNKIADLSRCTFRGARVQASVVQISPGRHSSPHHKIKSCNTLVPTTIVRGSLPVHLSVESANGTPFLHSTDIRKLIKDPTEILTNTSVMAKGRTKGWVILIPRVGMPDASLVKALKLDTLTQLSDCVIALEFSSKNSALKAEGRLHSHWNEFKDLYRGTGARYVTISRLSFWLNSIAIATTI